MGQREEPFLPDALRHLLMRGTALTTPVSNMRTFPGLLRAYWTGDHKKEAWLFTAGIAILTMALSYNGIQLGKQAAQVLNARAIFQSPTNPDPLGYYAATVGLWFMMAVGQTALNTTRHLLSSNLHRKWRGWLAGQFSKAMLDEKGTILHLMHNRDEAENTPLKSPDGIDQRVTDCTKDLTGGAIGLTMGLLGAASSIVFAAIELSKLTTPVRGLEFLGEYGTLTLAFGAAAVCVPLGTYIARKIGKMIADVTVLLQAKEAAYRSNANNITRTAFHIAANAGKEIQQKLNDRLYYDVDKTWTRYNNIHAGFMGFKGVYAPFSGNIAAYLPALPAFASKAIGFKGYMTFSGIVGALMDNLEWMIDVMPAIANMKANGWRLNELASAIENVQDYQGFYSKTGISEFRHHKSNAILGLLVRDLQLMQKGHDAKPFLEAGHISLRPGDWAYIEGPNGSGKSCLLKAVMGKGLWPYGRGKILTHKNAKMFYAEQEIELEQLSLRQLLTYPSGEDKFSEEELLHIMHETDLDHLKNELDEVYRGGKPWKEVLSGGQKEKLILARILLQKPSIILLDEATAAMDVRSKLRFHELIKEYCPRAIVLSIMHGETPPVTREGKPFFTTVLKLEDGWVHQKPATKAPAPPSSGRNWFAVPNGMIYEPKYS